MVNLDAALEHHLLQVPVAEGVSEVPAHTEQDDVFFEAVAFEVDHAGNLGGVSWGPSLPKLRLPLLTQQNRTSSPGFGGDSGWPLGSFGVRTSGTSSTKSA